jgi:hypothetical protein
MLNKMEFLIFYHSTSKHGVSPPATLTNLSFPGQRKTGQRRALFENEIYPTHALSELAYRMQQFSLLCHLLLVTNHDHLKHHRSNR